MNDGFKINNPEWRKTVTNEKIMLCGNIEASEYQVMLIIEKLTPILLRKYDSYPTENDIAMMVLLMRGI